MNSSNNFKIKVSGQEKNTDIVKYMLGFDGCQKNIIKRKCDFCDIKTGHILFIVFQHYIFFFIF